MIFDLSFTGEQEIQELDLDYYFQNTRREEDQQNNARNEENRRQRASNETKSEKPLQEL
jgi:hypothetical protein